MKIKVGILIVALFLPLSCAGVQGVKRNMGQAVMYGMVYDDENMPVQGAVVSINGRVTAQTDIQGRFIINSKKRDSFLIELEKAGFEKVKAEFIFDPLDALHFTLVNAQQLLSRSEEAMDGRRYEQAIVLCDRALALEPRQPEALFLKALALVQTKQYASARNVLRELENRIGPKEYIKALQEKMGDE
jgi:tetratricopeptide (TPR) repeat protein